VRPMVMAEETRMVVLFHEFVTDCCVGVTQTIYWGRCGCRSIGWTEAEVSNCKCDVETSERACSRISVSFRFPLTFDSSLPTFFFK
jgi:hypothetical protein